MSRKNRNTIGSVILSQDLPLRFEEQLYLPPVFVDSCDRRRSQVHVFSQEFEDLTDLTHLRQLK
jgi:hypothetical protein